MAFPINIHPAVVHFPIALLLVASAAGLTYIYLRPRFELQVLTWWCMFLGWVSGIVAIITGLFSQGGLPVDAPYRGTLNAHTTLGFLTLAVYGGMLYRRWLYGSQQRKRPLDFPHADPLDDPGRRVMLTVLLIAGAILVVLGGWFGGRLVYEWGVNVG